MASTGLYLYGLIRATDDLELGKIGLPHDGKPGRVHTVRVASLGAVVSDLGTRQKILPLRQNLVPHHRVIREVMQTTTILPMTFGHVARSEAEVAGALRRNGEAIGAQLDRVDGKVELGLKVRWDVDNLFEHILDLAPELRAYRDQLYGRPAAPSQAEKLELGRMFDERRAQEREAQTAAVIELLHARYSDVKVNPPRGETTLMDLAFLVERGGIEAFEERVRQIAGAFPVQYVFDYSGPWAPYHFVELDLESVAADAEQGE
jgi:hypothetical protein